VSLTAEFSTDVTLVIYQNEWALSHVELCDQGHTSWFSSFILSNCPKTGLNHFDISLTGAATTHFSVALYQKERAQIFSQETTSHELRVIDLFHSYIRLKQISVHFKV
jgi:hypothetical protein